MLIDLDDLELHEIRNKRDALNERVGQINKKYPGTDDKSFKQAQADIAKYKFEDGEAARLLHVEQTSRSQAD